MRSKSAIVLITILTLIATVCASTSSLAQTESKVGLVIQFDPNNDPETFCISFEGDEISGEKVLELALEQKYINELTIHWDNIGAAICKIDDLGCPENSCLLCQAPYYWSYWHLDTTNNQWIYSIKGASNYPVHNMDVEGWAWTQKPETPPKLLSFDEICNSPTATATSTNTATATVTDTPKPSFTLTWTPTALSFPTNTPIPTNANSNIVHPSPTPTKTNTPILFITPPAKHTSTQTSTPTRIQELFSETNGETPLPDEDAKPPLKSTARIQTNKLKQDQYPQSPKDTGNSTIPLGIILGASFVGFVILASIIGGGIIFILIQIKQKSKNS